MRGVLNSFQRAMLQWSELHPYNAVHLVRVPGEADPGQLSTTISHLLERKGLTHLTLDLPRNAFAFEGGPGTCDLKVLAPAPGDASSWETEIEWQLNTPFEIRPRMSPFRFFFAPEADAFSLGLAYFHPVADAESVVHLLRDILETHLGRPAPDAGALLELYPPRRDHWLLARPRLLVGRWRAAFSQISNIRRSYRVKCRDARDLSAGALCFELGAGDFIRLRKAAKAIGVTLHDFFLALLFKSVSPLAPGRIKARRRRALTLGTIVNIRQELGIPSRSTFGLFLGSFLVTHEAPENLAVEALAREVHRQTARVKAGRFYMGTALELAVGRLLLRFLPMERRPGFYQKAYPLWGGITNMNLNPLWPQEPGRAGINYLRVVSPGPITPLVLSLSTSGEVLNVGLSYRRSVFARTEMEGVRDALLDLVRNLKTEP